MSKIALIDIAERMVRTFIQATGAALATGAAGLEVTSLSSWQALAVGGVSAGLSAVMGLITAGFGDRSTASLIPATDGADH
jgi:hypothetical protein